MSFRPVALLSLALCATLLTACGSQPMPMAGTQARSLGLHARDAASANPLPLADAAVKAIAFMKAQTQFQNPRLVSIAGRGLDMQGHLVPLLGASWSFKFYVNTADSTDTVLMTVVQHVEGPIELVNPNETRDPNAAPMRLLDASKLQPPTQVVPFAIRLGLKVSHNGPAFNYFDVTYNSFYADPSQADADVADVKSYYQQDAVDGLHIPADTQAPAGQPAAAPPAKPSKMNAAELHSPKTGAPLPANAARI